MNEKILIVHNYYKIAGGEDTVVANEMSMLTRRGHKVHLYSRNNNELDGMSFFRKLLLPFTTIYNPRTYKDVVRIIKDEKIDIVHVHNTLNLVSPAVFFAAIKCRVPVVLTIHNYRLLCPGALLYRDHAVCEDCIEKGLVCAIRHKCYRGSLAQTAICVLSTKINRMLGIYEKINYICLTDFNKSKLLELRKAAVDLDESRVYVKNNFMPKDPGDILAADKRKKRIIYAGRLDESKGVDMLIKAWDVFTKKYPDDKSELLICGSGPMDKWCEDYVNDNEIDRIVLNGATNHDEVLRLMAESSAMVLPTRWYEGFPMSIVESYSVGTPVIGPAMGNVGNLIDDGNTGYRYEADNVQALAGVIEKALCTDISEMYDKAYRLFADKYTEEINYSKLKEIYEDCISRNNAQ